MPLILVVDDEVAIREILAEMLTALRYEVRQAASASAALTLAKSERPGAILLDIGLPDARGTQALDQLRELRPDVPIIMVTANTDEDLARETLRRGAFDYIVKPFNLDRLSAVLEAALAG